MRQPVSGDTAKITTEEGYVFNVPVAKASKHVSEPTVSLDVSSMCQ